MSTQKLFPHIQVPNQSSPNFVVVTNISPLAKENQVRDFFLFCGRIRQFELVTDHSTLDGQKMALIEFESASAARTAVLLSGAQLVDRHVNVAFLFKDIKLDDTLPASISSKQEQGVSTQQGETGGDKNVAQEHKPKSNIIAEILAAGYMLSDQIIESARRFDERLGISSSAKNVYDQIGQKAHEYAEIYGVDEKLQNIKKDVENSGVPAKAQAQYEQLRQTATEMSQKARETELGKKIEGTYTATADRGQEIHEEALKIKQEKERQAAKAK